MAVAAAVSEAEVHLAEGLVAEVEVAGNNGMSKRRSCFRESIEIKNFMSPKYIIPNQTRIGHVHLKVSNLDKSLAFYCKLLGFELISKYGEDLAFISAGGYHHHIGLNTWYSKDSKPTATHSPGLFHTAILYPERKDLAFIYQRLLKAKIPLTGVADHGVSEALYLSDPDDNGIELYWDRPRDQWPLNEKGVLEMYTKPLDVDNLLSELK